MVNGNFEQLIGEVKPKDLTMTTLLLSAKACAILANSPCRKLIVDSKMDETKQSTESARPMGMGDSNKSTELAVNPEYEKAEWEIKFEMNK